jgi:hypothetical protein
LPDKPVLDVASMLVLAITDPFISVSATFWDMVVAVTAFMLYSLLLYFRLLTAVKMQLYGIRDISVLGHLRLLRAFCPNRRGYCQNQRTYIIVYTLFGNNACFALTLNDQNNHNHYPNLIP